MSSWTSVVSQIQDATPVSAATINPPITALTTRTQYLYDRLNASSDEAALIALNQPVVEQAVGQHSVVYFDGESTIPGLKLCSPRIASLANHPFFRGANSAYVFGIVKDFSSDTTADVCLQGILSAPALLTNLLDNPEEYPTFTSGPLFLSSIEDGKLTPYPSGLAIFVAYALSKTEVYINPNQESLSELFWSFRYNLLDRPAGEVTAGWTMETADPKKVGWITATEKLSTDELRLLFPTGTLPKYYYQLPDPATVGIDNLELSAGEQAAAINLRLALPARPNAFSFLTVNGVVYSPRTADDDRSSYAINDVGIWWFADIYDDHSDGEFDQPWATDLATSLKCTVSSSTHIALTDAEGQAITGLDHAPGLVVGTVVRFFAGTGGVIPTEINDSTNYYVESVADGYFTISDSNGGSPISLSAGTAPWYLKWQPSFWSFAKGSTCSRPWMNLQFVKLNPDVRQSVVTSLQTDQTVATPAIQITGLNTTTPAATGDLQLKLELPVSETWTGSTVAAGTAIKGLRYNSTLESLEFSTGKVVSELRNGVGVQIAETSTGAGIYTISSTNAYASSITELEPEQARLEYYGLNSFLTLDWSTTPNGFVGKFILPDNLTTSVGNSLNINLVLFGKTSSATAAKLLFKYEYAVAKLGTALVSSVISNPALVYTMPASYAQYVPFETTANTFTIPASSLAGKATVNFRIHRLKPTNTSGYYTGVIGVSGVYWTLS